MLNAIYNLPNIVLLLAAEYWSTGSAPRAMMTWTRCRSASRARVLTAYGPTFTGHGGGTPPVRRRRRDVQHRDVRRRPSGISRSGISRSHRSRLWRSAAAAPMPADMSPTWFRGPYAAGWQPPLEIAAFVAATSLGSRRSMRGSIAGSAPRAGESHVCAALFVSRRLARSGRVLVPARRCAYSGTRSSSRSAARSRSSISSTCTARARGRRRDQQLRLSRRAVCDAGLSAGSATASAATLPFLAVGALLLPISIAVMAHAPRFALPSAPVLIGSQLLAGALPVMWPLTCEGWCPRIVSARRSASCGSCRTQGIAGANLVAGRLNDAFGAGPLNPGGYQPMMWYFFLSSLAGFFFALALWRRAGRQRHEAPHADQAAIPAPVG
jgi:hypothetical protein